jgi:ligand-binding sensor domain-containing protein
MDANYNFSYNRDGFFVYSDNQWNSYNGITIPLLKDTVLDLLAVAHNPKTKKTYFGSYVNGGIVEFTPESIKLYKQEALSSNIVFTNYACTGLTIDASGNLWASNPGSDKPLVVQKTDGTWKKFPVAAINSTSKLGRMVADRFNQIWISLIYQGLCVYNYGSDIDNVNDDKSMLLTGAFGNGSLPDLSVNCLAIDKTDQLWIGTNKGIGVIYCPQNIFQPGGCDAQKIIVSGADGIAGYLLEAEKVTAIAVDGGNRKWVGTENGVWLLSENGTKEIFHFTTDNSPLFSNIIIDIAVDDKTGVVYIGTDKGIIAYQSDATEPVLADDCELMISPNPVNHNYDGLINVRDLPYNCSVKVMDAAGYMIYQGRSNGGTFSWDGKNYLGEKAASGVYYITALSNDGTYSCRGKLIIIN